MALRISVDVFSGRPNRTIELEGSEADDALERLRPVRLLGGEDPGLPPGPTLGYRGVVIEQTGDRLAEDLPREFRLVGSALFGSGLAHRVADEGFEESICGSTGPLRRLELEEDFFERLREEIERFRDIRCRMATFWFLPLAMKAADAADVQTSSPAWTKTLRTSQ